MTDAQRHEPTPETDDEGRIIEPPNSTVDDWHGQVAQRQEEVADEAMDDADGDEERAERLFRSRGGDRPESLP
jgi:hypothetical protein